MNYSLAELEDLGIRVGVNPKIHRSVIFFNPAKIVLGHHVRIDCFSLLSAGNEGITIGRNVHLAASSFIFGARGRVVIADFSAISARVCLYTASDDFSEGYLTSPTVPEQYTKVKCGPIILGRHALIGAGSIVLPGVTLGKGSSVGAMSLVRQDVGDYEIVAGVPSRVIGHRDAGKLQELATAYLEAEGRVD